MSGSNWEIIYDNSMVLYEGNGIDWWIVENKENAKCFWCESVEDAEFLIKALNNHSLTIVGADTTEASKLCANPT